MMYVVISSEDGGKSWYFVRDWFDRDKALEDITNLNRELPDEKHEMHIMSIHAFYALAMSEGVPVPENRY